MSFGVHLNGGRGWAAVSPTASLTSVALLSMVLNVLIQPCHALMIAVLMRNLSAMGSMPSASFRDVMHVMLGSNIGRLMSEPISLFLQ